MDTRKIGAPTRNELRAMITERMDRKDTDGNALYLLRRGLRSLELFVTPDTVGGDLAMDICAAIDEIERIAKLEKALNGIVDEIKNYGFIGVEGVSEHHENHWSGSPAMQEAITLLQTPKP